jgi:hypothetical protein
MAAMIHDNTPAGVNVSELEVCSKWVRDWNNLDAEAVALTCGGSLHFRLDRLVSESWSASTKSLASRVLVHIFSGQNRCRLADSVVKMGNAAATNEDLVNVDRCRSSDGGSKGGVESLSECLSQICLQVVHAEVLLAFRRCRLSRTLPLLLAIPRGAQTRHRSSQNDVEGGFMASPEVSAVVQYLRSGESGVDASASLVLIARIATLARKAEISDLAAWCDQRARRRKA